MKKIAKKTASKSAVNSATTTVAEVEGKEVVPVETKTATDTKPKETAPQVEAKEPKAAEVIAPSAPAAGSLAERVAQAIAYIKLAIAILAIQAPPLTAAQRKRMAKLPNGGEKYVPTLSQLSETLGVQIRTQPTATMSTALQMATTLQPLLTLLVGFLQEVQDTGFQAKSDSWSTASALYAVFKRMSHKDPSLKTQLAPVADFFKSRAPKRGSKRGKSAEAAPKSAPQANAEAQAPSPVPSAGTTPAGADGNHAGSA